MRFQFELVHVTPIMKELQWMRIADKINFDISIFTFKVINQMLPDWLFRFPSVGDIQSRLTRQVNDLVVYRTSTDIGARAISIKGPKIWNSIPLNIKTSSTISVFKEKLKKHILNDNA